MRILELPMAWTQGISVRGWPALESKYSELSFMERAMGIEPTSEAWEASILPLYDARSGLILLQLGRDGHGLPFSIIFQNINFMAKL